MQSLQYNPLEYIRIPRPVGRIAFVVDMVRHKTVLDLGALDETAYADKAETRFWLHREICAAALKVYGVDNSDLIPEGGLTPFPKSVIFKEDVYRLERVLHKIGDVDIIVAGELIEHLPNPLSFLRSIKGIDSLQGKDLLITTPNATSLHNILLGVIKRESTHVDHLSVYSFKTLNTLCKKAGFESWTIIPYHVSFPETILRARGTRRLIAVLLEAMVNFWEHAFPLLSGGWIVQIKI